MGMYKRFAQERVEEALADTPVVLLVGPRRAGKTTLVRKLSDADRAYITLDDPIALEAAQSDPSGFIQGLNQVILDEIQRAPELLLAIKKAVDEDYRPGRFVLTGSANVLTLPRVADSLAGRMETIRLLPLARAEVNGAPPSFLNRLFAGNLSSDSAALIGDDLIRLALCGGFPEAIGRHSERRRQSWARAYLTSILTRDLRDIAEIEKLTELPKFVRLLAQHSARLVNYSRLGAGIGVSYKTPGQQEGWPAKRRAPFLCRPASAGAACRSHRRGCAGGPRRYADDPRAGHRGCARSRPDRGAATAPGPLPAPPG